MNRKRRDTEIRIPLIFYIFVGVNEKSRGRAIAVTGQGTMSLAGAGGAREPLPTGPRRKLLRPPESKPWVCALLPTGNPRRKAKPLPTKQVARLALYRRRAVTRRRRTRTQKQTKGLRNLGSRDDVPCGCRAEPAKLCRQATPAKAVSELS